MDRISLSYSDFKTLASSKILPIQYLQQELDSGRTYDLFVFDGPMKYEASISTSGDVSDFETNYKAGANQPLAEFPKDDNGSVRVSTYFPALGMVPTFQGFQFECSGDSTTFYDIELGTAWRIWGGCAWLSELTAANSGDYIECSIIDKNDVLGYFAYYGLTVGVNVLELKKYVKHEYALKFLDAPHTEVEFVAPGVMGDVIYPGLFIRIAYTNTSPSNIRFIARLQVFEG